MAVGIELNGMVYNFCNGCNHSEIDLKDNGLNLGGRHAEAFIDQIDRIQELAQENVRNLGAPSGSLKFTYRNNQFHDVSLISQGCGRCGNLNQRVPVLG